MGLCYLAGERARAGTFSLRVGHSAVLVRIKDSPCKIQTHITLNRKKKASLLHFSLHIPNLIRCKRKFSSALTELIQLFMMVDCAFLLVQIIPINLVCFRRSELVLEARC